MDPAARTQLIESLALGHVPLRDLAALSARDVGALSKLGAIAVEAGKLERAARIFAALEVIEPDRPIHTLHRAQVEAQSGLIEEAIASATRYLDREEHRPPEVLVVALVLRAKLYVKTAPDLADHDQTAARAIAASSAVALAALTDALARGFGEVR